MTAELPSVQAVRAAIAKQGLPRWDTLADYEIAMPLGPGFLGLSRTGSVALLVPLDVVPTATGRRGGGFSLSCAPRVAFQYHGHRWEQAAATLECGTADMIDPFLVLVIDVARRLAESVRPTWQAVVDCVDEWQKLLARREPMTVERQMGLWAELWVMSIASDLDRLAAAWRGPEAEATDFFLSGIGLEVKASRQRLIHRVSQRQVHEPLGVHEAYLLSLWVGVDPGLGKSLSELADEALRRASDAPALLKHLALVGYSPADRDHYRVRFIVLEAPQWFRAEDVPRVRAADPEVSELRYVVALRPECGLGEEGVKRLWRHFCGTESPLERHSRATP